jgi:N4-(beta-N-acetylglucosaminyl)-L-asparaginase
MKRRTFLKAAAAAGILAQRNIMQAAENAQFRPIVIASGNGLQATARAMELIKQGKDAIEAVVEGVTIVEDDPKDNSVGYGGLPNEEGVVELDASVMHGPTGRGGAVAAMQNIRHAAKVAKLVMERTDHVLIVGAGALKFAKAHGFKEEDLLTEESREAWLKWKETLSNRDDWLPPHDEKTKDVSAIINKANRHYGTINCNALDLKGNLSGCTTTSGLAFKLAGRVGDSPILGAGLWIDNEVGAAGSTGRGEANLLACSSVMVVEYMRQGKSPEAACLAACERIAKQTRMRRLLDDEGRPNFDVRFYAINKRGEYGSATIWSGGTFTVNTGEQQSRQLDSAFLFRKKSS